VEIRFQRGFAVLGLIGLILASATAPALAHRQSDAAPAPSPVAGKDKGVDYNDPDNWLCRPGKETLCTTNLDAMQVDADGKRTYQRFVPAAWSPIDCFYVYPTVSHQTTDYADLTEDPEIDSTLRSQAARLSEHCRLFAPIYRQFTLPGLARAMKRGDDMKTTFDMPYQDVLTAWKHYLKHNNHGRGVILIGHSQGTILLQRLIAEEIDGKPMQKQLVSAFLAGDPSLPVPAGQRMGGVFKHIPLCDQASETGCVYVWGDYLGDAPVPGEMFGKAPGGGLAAACVSPAAPAGGEGALKTYFPRPADAPPSDPPYVELIDQLSGRCKADEDGNALRVTILPSRFAERLEGAFSYSARNPSWGLHRLDLNLLQGNVVDVAGLETAAWKGK
jgi:hypothetical protein